ncbi:MAG: class I SAM-dependent methyltransferase [candidate division Zixibacteria bacterium]|nr:class I SAM-dependent methyltransferase [candidate division Zixibacteria bacterium]
MHWLEFYNIAERHQDLINPTSEEKITKLGEKMKMNDSTRIIDFGCGCGLPLILWAKQFGISGIGIEFRERSLNRAKELVAESRLENKIELVRADASKYKFEPGGFDIASCMGASFIWEGFQPTLKVLKKALKPGGQILIGEPYWMTDNVPPKYATRESFHSELDILKIIQREDLDLAYMVRSSPDEWNRYETANWEGMISWLNENPDHSERQEVIDKMHEWQDDYFRYGRQYLGWALYVLIPKL